MDTNFDRVCAKLDSIAGDLDSVRVKLRGFNAKMERAGISILSSALAVTVLTLLLFALTACSHTQPGVEVRVVERIVEVPKPCPAERPTRPAPFVRPTGEGLEALAAALAAKLGEYSLPGRYADQAEAYFAACPPSS